MFEKKLESEARGITDRFEKELALKRELTTVLEDLQKEVNRLREIITTRLSTDVASSSTVVKPASSQGNKILKN